MPLSNNNKILFSILFLAIIVTLVIFVVIPTLFPNNLKIKDLDWPDRVFFTPDNYPGLEGEKKYLKEYYDYKGKEFMESKKSEMLLASQNGTLVEWIGKKGTLAGYSSTRVVYNNTNVNIWYYYWMQGETPHYKDQNSEPKDFTDKFEECKLNSEACYKRNNLMVSYNRQ